MSSGSLLCAVAKISAVSLALTKSEEARIEKSGNFLAARSACSLPKSVRGGFAFPCHLPMAFHSDCPCRTRSNFVMSYDDSLYTWQHYDFSPPYER